MNVETKVAIGDPKDKICEVAENLHADLLVMGSRAFGPIKRYGFIIYFSLSCYCMSTFLQATL